MRKMPFFHVTATGNVSQIMKEGLKGGVKPRNRNEVLSVPSIFVLITKRDNVTDSIAINQIWPEEDVDQYAVFRISSAGVTGPILPDNVPEYLAPLHRIIEQEVIEPKYLRLIKIRQIHFPGRKLAEINNACYERRLTSEEWDLARHYLHPLWIWAQEKYEANTTTATSGKEKRRIPRKK